MTRKPRIHYKGALYHVIARGNNRMKIIKNNKEKQNYLELVKRYKNRYNFKLYAYCIMDNHVHLVIEVDEIPLSKIMQGIQQVYTQRYNKANERTGHVFEQRYKAILCNKDEYLLNLIRYIHQNPKRAGITKDANYDWSSHNAYINNDKELVDIDFPLSILGSQKKEAIKIYNEFMEETEKLDEKKLRIYEDKKIEEIKEQDNSLINSKENKTSIEKLIEDIIEISSTNREELTSRKRTKRITDTRKAIIILGKKYSNVSNKELSKLLNISESAISKIISGRYEETEYLKDLIDRVTEKSICQA